MILQDRLPHLPQELIISIASFLNKPDLAVCVRVSHQWHHVFNSILWYTFDDGCQLSSNVFSREHNWDDLKWLEPALRNNIQHIRHLVIHSSQTIDVCATTGCHNLLSITLPDMIPFQPPKTYTRQTKSRPVSALAMQNIAPRPRQICLDPDEAELENMLEKLIIDPRFENGMELSGTWLSDQDELEFRHVQQFWILLEQNRDTLQRLSINDVAAKVLTPFRDNTVLLEFLRLCSGLRFLRIPRQQGLDLDELLGCFPHLNCLQLGFRNDDWRNYEPSGYTFRIPPTGQVALARAGSPVTRPYPQLPVLVDLTINEDISAPKIARLLEWMPTLTRLSFLSFDQVTTNPYQPSTLRLSDAEKRLLHRIKSFQLISNNSFHNRREVPLLQLMPNLEQLAMPLVSNSIIDTLCSHNPLLHTFRRSTDPKRTMGLSETRVPTHLRKLLEQCAHLTTLDIVQHWIKLGDWVDNEEEPWACRGLQVFRCSIRNVWRCSDDRDDDDDDDEVAKTTPDRHRDLSDELRRTEESCKAQRRLFRKLAQLHRLQVLEFGVVQRSDKSCTLAAVKDASGKVVEQQRKVVYTVELKSFKDTLRLTMETGLDQLGALKELRLFGFEGVAHRITERELEWMVRSWPQLAVMRGLSYDRRVTIGDKARQRRDRLREFVHGLKPSVVHESLFKYIIDDYPPNGNIQTV
ncbi:hypothetical protein CPB97_002816 [Podila verticillata]|nr:hypothetical protein CPB97_002816 [Podila verticillata]